MNVRVLVLGIATSLALTGKATEPVDYTREIKPLLKQRCYACHGALKQKANLRLDTGAFIRRGSKNGAVIVTNDVERSPLILRVASKDPDERMPQQGEPLSPEQIELLRGGIGQGAPS